MIGKAVTGIRNLTNGSREGHFTELFLRLTIWRDQLLVGVPIGFPLPSGLRFLNVSQAG